jgi:hypothetical protein
VTGDSQGDQEPLRAAALRCAFEELLDQVQDCEREWRLRDRIDHDIWMRVVRLDPERLDSEGDEQA